MINSVLSPRCKVVALLNLIWPDSLSDTNHPEELVDIISRVSDQGAKDDEDVVDVVLSKNGVSLLFRRGHSLSDSGNVSYASIQVR